MPNQEDGIGEAVTKDVATMEDLKKLESSLGSKFDAMMALLQEMKLNSIPTTMTAPPLVPVASTPLMGFVLRKDTTQVESEENLVDTPPQKPKESEDYSAVPPPSRYTPEPFVPMPHIISQGAPPMLDTSNFANWQYLMKSHISSSSIELMRIVEEGYNPVNAKNPTRGELVESNSMPPPYP